VPPTELTHKVLVVQVNGVVMATKVKRPDSKRTQKSKIVTIERRNIRKNIARNGGRF
jgi:hypothetical protein